MQNKCSWNPINVPLSLRSRSSAALEISATSLETSAKCLVSFHPKLFRGHDAGRSTPYRSISKYHRHGIGLMARSLCLSQALVMMPALGQNAKYSARVNVVRFASELGHCAMRSALRIRANREIASGVCCGSIAFRHACVGKKAPVGPTVHQSAALLTDHVTGGYFGHSDFVFGAAAAFMRSCRPSYKFGHA